MLVMQSLSGSWCLVCVLCEAPWPGIYRQLARHADGALQARQQSFSVRNEGRRAGGGGPAEKPAHGTAWRLCVEAAPGGAGRGATWGRCVPSKRGR